MMKPKILAFSGSARKDSFNQKLIRIAARGAQEAGSEVTLVDLRDYVMPLYDGDLETNSGIPDTVKKFKTLMKAHDGFLMACPEYNSSITPLLKNTIDWCSRQEAGETPLVCFQGKVTSLMSASPGALGGLRGLVTVRSILGNIGSIVLPRQVAVPRAHEAFGSDGNLKDAQLQESILKLGQELAEFLFKLKV
jgi:NAD(P)H-dependent FMN reductase